MTVVDGDPATKLDAAAIRDAVRRRDVGGDGAPVDGAGAAGAPGGSSVRPPGYGETQPRLDDDRLPVVLVVLDGLGDRPVPELGGRTPSEAARHARPRRAGGPRGVRLAPALRLGPRAVVRARALGDVRVRRRAVPRARGAGGARRGGRRAGRGRGHPRGAADRADRRRRDGSGSPGGSGPTTPTTRRGCSTTWPGSPAARRAPHPAPPPRRGAARADRARERRRHRLRPVLRGPPPVAAGAAAGRGARGRADRRGPGGAAARGPRRPARPPRQPRPHRPRPPGAGGAHDEVVGRAVADPVVRRAERRRRRRGDQHRALPGPRLRARDGVAAPATRRGRTRRPPRPGWPPRTS